MPKNKTEFNKCHVVNFHYLSSICSSGFISLSLFAGTFPRNITPSAAAKMNLSAGEPLVLRLCDSAVLSVLFKNSCFLACKRYHVSNCLELCFFFFSISVIRAADGGGCC